MPVGNCPQGGVSVNHTPLTRGRRHYTSSEDARTTAAHRKGALATQDCRRARTCKAEKLLLREASHRLLLLGYTAQRNRRAPNHSGSLQSCRAREDRPATGNLQAGSSKGWHPALFLRRIARRYCALYRIPYGTLHREWPSRVCASALPVPSNRSARPLSPCGPPLPTPSLSN